MTLAALAAGMLLQWLHSFSGPVPPQNCKEVAQSHLGGSPMKLYNHALAPNPRRVRIFAAEKGIELALEEVDILTKPHR